MAYLKVSPPRSPISHFQTVITLHILNLQVLLELFPALYTSSHKFLKNTKDMAPKKDTQTTKFESP